MKNVLNRVYRREGITVVQRLSILVENRSQTRRLMCNPWRALNPGATIATSLVCPVVVQSSIAPGAEEPAIIDTLLSGGCALVCICARSSHRRGAIRLSSYDVRFSAYWNRRTARLLVSVAIGVLATSIAAANYAHHPPGALTDFDQIYVAARSLLAGRDPYLAVRAEGFPFPFYYPATAGVIAFPLAFLSLESARVLFIGIGTALCAWALTREHWYPLVALCSGSYIAALTIVQWSPLLIGAAFQAPIIAGAILSAKPTVGLALAAGFWLTTPKRTKLFLLGGVAMLAVSFAAYPQWFSSWLAAMRYAPHIRPLFTLLPFGPLLLLAIVKWRRPEARLLFTLAFVPQTPAMYGTLLLFLIPSSRMEMLTLVLLADLAYFAVSRYPQLGAIGPAELAQRVHATGWILILLLYLPCLAMILRRANEGQLPAWLENSVSRLQRRRFAAGPVE